MESWVFIYGDREYAEDLKKYRYGFYLNKSTKEKYSFEEGIAHLVGIEKEDSVYNMWWWENG